MMLWILDGHEPVEERDPIAWSQWYQQIENRRVGQDIVNGMEVSTVFLGTDHHTSGTGLPVLFETMVFWLESNRSNECQRYVTWYEAVAGHAAMVVRVKQAKGGER